MSYRWSMILVVTAARMPAGDGSLRGVATMGA